MKRSGICVLGMVAALSGCTTSGPERPSPGLAERYDVVIAICVDRLTSTQDFCDRIHESSADKVYANVLFGKAGGHDVGVRVQVTDGGDVIETSPVNHVPPNRSWLHGVEIPRSRTCVSTRCKLIVYALVDGIDVARSTFAFR